MNLEPATRLAEKIVGELTPYCERIAVAGSIRRRRPAVNDVDIVLTPKSPADNVEIIARCSRSAKLMKQGEQYVVFELATGFQLDLWFARRGDVAADLFAEADPANFGILLLARTGSAMHNVFLAQRAAAMGLHFSPTRGIISGAKQNARGDWVGGSVIASGEEAEIFASLNLRFVPPERRER